jgi:two-component system OmpR family response regulator
VRLLLVEDDPQIGDGLAMALRRSGYRVDLMRDGRDADVALSTQDYDLVILDLGLPGMDGYTLLRRLRESRKDTPVLILSARDELTDRVRGLDLGADDYIVKPFELADLEARVRAVARRSLAASGGDVAVGQLCYRMAQRRFYANEVPLELSRREFGVLELLLLRRGRVVSKAQIQQHLCEWDESLSDAAIELYVHRVRRKLEAVPVEIRTVRGFGYLLQTLDGSG